MGVLNGYRVKDLLHLRSMHARHRRRIKSWSAHFRRAIDDGSFRIPLPVIVQILPTERCNLTCTMCNQWGDRGFYPGRRAAVGDAPIDKLIAFLRSIESEDFLLSIHGGEPFCYKHTDELLDYVIETQRDTIITTNGTLLDRYMSKLAKLRNAMYIISIDGDRDSNDRIRGEGTFQKVKDNLVRLKESCLSQSGLTPLLSMNFCISESIGPSDIAAAYRTAKDLGFLNINYGLRWFLTESAGRRYRRQLEEHFQITASDCWKTWLCDLSGFDAEGTARALAAIKNSIRNRLRLPYVSITPRYAKTAEQIRSYYRDHSYCFGREKCRFPFYFVRVHSNGEIIFCPGYRDIVAGNVFVDDFDTVFNSGTARKFREFCMNDRFAVCSKCCGLYLTHEADKFLK